MPAFLGKRFHQRLLRETLIKVFPAPDLRREAAYSSANLCASATDSKEVLISSALP